MTYTALEALFMLVCICIGALGGARAGGPWPAAGLAAAFVAAQFALLILTSP